MNDATPLKKSEDEPFHLRQLDDDGNPFAVCRHLDVRGMTCPMPALKSLEISKSLVMGEVLEVVGDWPGSKFEVPFAITGKPGFEIVRIIESDIPDDETWWIYVRRA
ncbi:MAG: sulfurtransferase TusA family protein [Planctomycetota bacterium]